MSRKVIEFMHRGITMQPPNASLANLARAMRQKDIGAIPIVENGKIVGMVTDRDIVIRGIAGDREFQKLTAKDIMSRDVVVCRETDTARSAAETMRKRKVRRLPVLNQGNTLTGMVSLGDITHSLPESKSGQLIKAVAEHHA